MTQRRIRRSHQERVQAALQRRALIAERYEAQCREEIQEAIQRREALALAKIARQEAKALGHRFYDPGTPCIYGHVSKRYTSCSTCKECSLAYPDKGYNSYERIRARRARKQAALRRAELAKLSNETS